MSEGAKMAIGAAVGAVVAPMVDKQLKASAHVAKATGLTPANATLGTQAAIAAAIAYGLSKLV